MLIEINNGRPTNIQLLRTTSTDKLNCEIIVSWPQVGVIHAIFGRTR